MENVSKIYFNYWCTRSQKRTENNTTEYDAVYKLYNILYNIKLVKEISNILKGTNLFMEEDMNDNYKTDIDAMVYEGLKADYCNQFFYNCENHVVHNPYNQEKRVLEAIERGDPDAAREAVYEDFSDFVGILSQDPVRHEKNIGIVNVTTSSRAAILS